MGKTCRVEFASWACIHFVVPGPIHSAQRTTSQSFTVRKGSGAGNEVLELDGRGRQPTAADLCLHDCDSGAQGTHMVPALPEDLYLGRRVWVGFQAGDHAIHIAKICCPLDEVFQQDNICLAAQIGDGYAVPDGEEAREARKWGRGLCCGFDDGAAAAVGQGPLAIDGKVRSQGGAMAGQKEIGIWRGEPPWQLRGQSRKLVFGGGALGAWRGRAKCLRSWPWQLFQKLRSPQAIRPLGADLLGSNAGGWGGSGGRI